MQKGRLKMVKTIRLTPGEVQHFVNVTSKCDFEIDILCDHIYIDAKSILGVLGLGLRKNLTVQYFGENPVFEKALNDKPIRVRSL